MSSLEELLKQRAELEQEIARARSQSRAQALQQVRELMRTYGLTPADFGADLKGHAAGQRVTRKAAVKYRDGAGNAWSGRGLMPKWLQAAVAGGAKIEDFAA